MRISTMARISYSSLVASFLLVACASAFTPPSNLESVQPWCEAKIDYTAANEYIDAHYGNQRTPYFASDQVLEPVFDARKGVYDDQSDSWTSPTVESSGFTLIQAPTKTTEWKDITHVRETYLPELKRIIETTFESSEISHAFFWNPMHRGEELTPTKEDGITPTASVAGAVHIDTDVGAYDDAESVVRHIEMNRIDTDSFPREEVVAALKDSRRFAIVNMWRNVAPLPVARAPMSLLASRYEGPGAFPEAVHDLTRSRWYTFPEMKPDELLLFLQYDRDKSTISDFWHCALKGIGDPSAPPRQSFDLRCFIVFKEQVPDSLDRFGAGRIRPLFDYEESATFCSEQGEKRRSS